MRILSISAACYLLTCFMVIPAQAGVEVVASKSLTLQPNGPRPGDAGSKYLNIEGKDNEKYASFGVLVFEIPKTLQGSGTEGAGRDCAACGSRLRP